MNSSPPKQRSAAAQGKASRSIIDRQRQKLTVPFLLVPTILLTLLFVIPLAQTIQISFSDWYGTFRTYDWVGGDNYEKLIRDSLFLQAVENTFTYFGVSLILLFPLALFYAWGLAKLKTGRSFFQVVIFAPAVLSVPVAGILWKFIYNPNFGILNEALRWIGLDSVTRPWLGDPSTALLGIIVAVIWHGSATWIILLLAGLEGIPREYGEAAALDGARDIQIFLRVTLPQLWPVLTTLVVLWFIESMQTFAFIYVMTEGGPHGTTEVMATYMYTLAFDGRMFAYGSAMAVVMTLMVLLISLVGFRSLRSERFA